LGVRPTAGGWTATGALEFMAAFREHETALAMQEAELLRRFDWRCAAAP
jgi:hypothetical protein